MSARTFRIAAALLLALGLSGQALAADAPKPPDQSWPWEGPFGKYDQAALQRGFHVYNQVCSACHALNHMYYRHLEDIGFSEEEVRAIASQVRVQDGPNDQGEMFMRPAKPSDPFKDPYKNEAEARYINNGAYPPSLSLIVRARKYGADYIDALLLGYEQPPEGEELGIGQYWNKYYPGHKIGMPQQLYPDIVEYEDGTEATPEQMSSDVTQFLKWASAPHLNERKQMGMMVMLFLVVFAGVMYGVKKKIWADLH